MKPLEDHVLLYDGDCPMCRMYSHAFVRANMLEQDGIVAYSEMCEEIKAMVDVNRARNEIALVDAKNRSVTYGIDSWLKIFTNRFRWSKPLLRFPPVYWFLKRLYYFISYNRKVIAPGKEFIKPGSCNPDFNLKWRWIYILLTSFFIAFVLNRYFKGIGIYRDSHIQFGLEWVGAIGQLLFQAGFVFFTRRDRLLHYFGQLMTISMIGALLLVPVILVRKFFPAFPEAGYAGYFLFPVTIMLWQHVRRVRILGLPSFLTFTWILYRVLLLGVFLSFIK